jgi:hypothetical protein
VKRRLSFERRLFGWTGVATDQKRMSLLGSVRHYPSTKGRGLQRELFERNIDCVSTGDKISFLLADGFPSFRSKVHLSPPSSLINKRSSITEQTTGSTPTTRKSQTKSQTAPAYQRELSHSRSPKSKDGIPN